MKTERLPLRSPADRTKAMRWIERVPLGWTLVFKPPTRSNDQNRRLWAFLDDIAAQVDWHGKKLSSEAWKDLFSACLRGQELVPNIDGNGFVALGARTSEMSPEEMSDLLQLIETWGVQRGVQFTDQTSSESEQSLEGTRAGPSSGAQGADGSARGNGG